MNYKKLIMVTSGENHNKFYEMKDLGNGTFNAIYGRVGASGTIKNYPMSKWDATYRAKINKGYQDVTDNVAEEVKITAVPIRKYKQVTNTIIENLLNRLQDFADKTIKKSYKVSSEKVTQIMIDKTRIKINNLINTTNLNYFNDALLNIFITLPRTMSKVNSYLAKSTDDFERIINREQDLLDVMEGQVNKNKVLLNTSLSANENDTILDLMGLEIIEANDKDIDYIKMKLGSNASRLKQAFKVTNLRTQKAFDEFIANNNNPNQKTLFHGSRNENWWSIINSGLVLRPNATINGKMFGMAFILQLSLKNQLGILLYEMPIGITNYHLLVL